MKDLGLLRGMVLHNLKYKRQRHHIILNTTFLKDLAEQNYQISPDMGMPI